MKILNKQIYSNNSNKARSKVLHETTEQVWGPVINNLRSRVWTQIYRQVESRVYENFKESGLESGRE